MSFRRHISFWILNEKVDYQNQISLHLILAGKTSLIKFFLKHLYNANLYAIKIFPKTSL